jgi:hypothetical protein
MTTDATETDSSRGTPAALVAVPETVLLQHVADEMVLLHLGNNTYYGLDPVGAHLLDLARSLPTADEVIAAMVTEFDATPDVVATDLARLLDELEASGLIVRGT